LREAFTEILVKADADDESKVQQDPVKTVVDTAPPVPAVPKVVYVVKKTNRRASIQNTVTYRSVSNEKEDLENLLTSAKYINESSDVMSDIERIKQQGL
jgi:hypothetical protein